jgi:hypothetical protein
MFLQCIMYSSRNVSRYPGSSLTNYDPGYVNPYFNNPHCGPWCGPWCGPGYGYGYGPLPYYAYPNYYSPNPYPYYLNPFFN